MSDGDTLDRAVLEAGGTGRAACLELSLSVSVWPPYSDPGRDLGFGGRGGW